MQEFFLKVFIQIFYALIKHSGAKFSTLISSRMKKMPFYLLLESYRILVNVQKLTQSLKLQIRYLVNVQWQYIKPG